MVEVHNDSVFVCILGENGDKIQEKFGILTSKLDKFRKSNCLFYKHLIFMYLCSIINF